MKAVKYIVLALVALVVIGLGGMIVTDRMSQPPETDPQIFIEQATAYHARIVRDNWGVPHIFGRREADVAFGLGYAHSEDDFKTIQDVVLATRGTLAASAGIDAAKTDYIVHLLRVWETVDANYAKLPADVRAQPPARYATRALRPNRTRMGGPSRDLSSTRFGFAQLAVPEADRKPAPRAT